MQFPAYLEFAIKSGLVEENSEVIALNHFFLSPHSFFVQGWNEVKEGHDKCVEALEKTSTTMIYQHECMKLLPIILQVKDFEKDGQKMCLNMYDIRLTDTFPSCGMNWPPEIHAVTDFLGVSVSISFLDFTSFTSHYFIQLPEVVSSLHAKAHSGSWTECKQPVHSAFRSYETEASVTLLPKLLSKIRVLIYAGDQDLICNYVGLENMIKNLTWNGGTGLGVRFLFLFVRRDLISWL